MVKYRFRLDDACEGMYKPNWERLTSLFIKYDVRPCVAVVPLNQDSSLCFKNGYTQSEYQEQLKIWKNLGWTFALHGFEHKYEIFDGGILKINNKSEFAGLDFESQHVKIKKGLAILEDYGLEINYWIAPGHSFDHNTILALKEEGIEFISDGFAYWPYREFGITWVPQQLWKGKRKLFGDWTVCLHPNTMRKKHFERLEKFLEKNKDKVDDFQELIPTKRAKTIIEKIRFRKTHFIIMLKRELNRYVKKIIQTL